METNLLSDRFRILLLDRILKSSWWRDTISQVGKRDLLSMDRLQSVWLHLYGASLAFLFECNSPRVVTSFGYALEVAYLLR